MNRALHTAWCLWPVKGTIIGASGVISRRVNDAWRFSLRKRDALISNEGSAPGGEEACVAFILPPHHAIIFM